MVLGKILGGTAIALLQGLVFLVLGLTIGVRFDFVMLAAMIAMMTVVSFGLTAARFRARLANGFHARLSRRDERAPDADVAPERRVSGVPSAPLDHATQSADLRRGGSMRRILYWNAH